MARILSKPHNNFFNFSCGVNIWEPSTFRNYAAHHLSKGVQLKHSLKYVDCCSIKEAEKDGSRTKELLVGPEVKCQLKEKESKGEGFDWDWPPWKILPQGYEAAGLTSVAFVFCHMDQMNISIDVIPMSHQSWWNAYVAGLVQSTLLGGYMQSQLPGGWIVKTLVGRSSLYQFVKEDQHPSGADYQAWDRHPLHKQWATHNTMMTTRVAGAEKGGGVLDKPIIEKTTPGRESEFDMRKSRKMSPPYRVLLHNDNYNKREYVVQVLMKVIPGMTLDNAVNIMQEAHYNDMSVVIVCSQADAEEYCTQLRGNGLLSSIEPADGGGCH